MSCGCQLSLPHNEFQPICLLIKSSNISRNVSGPAMGTVWSTLTQIWPYSTLFLLPNSTIAPKIQSQSNYRKLTCCTCCCRGEFPSSSLVTQPLVFSFGFGPTSACILPSGIWYLHRQEGANFSVRLGRGRSIVATMGCVWCAWNNRDLWEVSTVWGELCALPGELSLCFNGAKMKTWWYWHKIMFSWILQIWLKPISC